MEWENENYSELPETIIDRLRRGDESIPTISPKIDQIILAEARSQFADRERAIPRALVRPAWAAIAASVALVAFVVNDFYDARSPSPQHVSDVDTPGRVDIVDVLALARSRQRNPAAVSQAQIEAVMTQIVSLTGNGDDS